MELIKRHKGLAIVGGLALILLAIIMVIFSRMIFSTGKTEYGDRLNNQIKIEDKVLKEVKEETEAKEGVTSVKTRVQGKIVYTIITVAKDVKKDAAKEFAKATLAKYPDDVIASYDFEFFLTQEPILDEEGNDTAYTISGSKHPDHDSISWTK